MRQAVGQEEKYTLGKQILQLNPDSASLGGVMNAV